MSKRVLAKRAPESKGTAVVKREKVGLPETREPVSPQTLLERVINQKLPMETMERLLAMWARDQFYAAMAGFQSECAIVEKRQTANITSRTKGTSFSYGYAAIEDLVDAVKPLFSKFGLSWTAKPEQTKDTVTAVVHVRHASGHEEITKFTVPIDAESSMTDPQKAGAALTYATRYAFRAAFGIQTRGEDTDAAGEGEKPARRSAPRPQAQEAPATAEEMKTAYDTVCELIRSLPADQANKLHDAADRNLDNKNGQALNALLESVRRQVNAKRGTAA